MTTCLYAVQIVENRNEKIRVEILFDRCHTMNKYEAESICVLTMDDPIKTWCTVSIFVRRLPVSSRNWLRYWHINWILIWQHKCYRFSCGIFGLFAFGWENDSQEEKDQISKHVKFNRKTFLSSQFSNLLENSEYRSNVLKTSFDSICECRDVINLHHWTVWIQNIWPVAFNQKSNSINFKKYENRKRSNVSQQ